MLIGGEQMIDHFLHVEIAIAFAERGESFVRREATGLATAKVVTGEKSAARTGQCVENVAHGG